MKDLQLAITIFDHGTEVADVRANLKPRDLIVAILEEFGSDLAYLGIDPSQYELRRTNGSALEDKIPLGAQLESERDLVLAEVVVPPPAHTSALVPPIYLHEPQSGQVFPIHWTPALIGRSDPKLSDEALLAVNLSGRKHADRVSRRHARIALHNGTLSIECLANNPILLRTQPKPIPLTIGRQYTLQADDVIELEYSQIQLQVLQRTA